MRLEKLGNIVEIIGGNAAPKGENAFGSSGLPFIKMKDLGNKHLTNNLIEIENLVSDSVAKVNRLKVIKKGAILLPRSGSVGLNHRAVLGVDAYMVSHICALQIKNEKEVFNQYLYYYLTTINFNSITKKTTGLDAITFQDLAKVEVSIPSLSDQIYFANILSQAENLIAQRKESIRLLDEFLKSTFLEMFGDNTTNDRGWKKIALVDACSNKNDIKCGPFGTQLGKSEYQIDGIPVWGIPQINSQFKILPKDFVTEKKALELEEYSVTPFDIVMSRKGNVGKCSLFPKVLSKGIIHSDVLRIRTDKAKMLPTFLLFQLKFSKHVETQINGVSKGAIMAGINVGKLKHIKIHLPPITLQTQFAQIVESTEVIKAQYLSSLQELENLYGSLSQRAFKGELRANDGEMMIAAEAKTDY